MTTVCGLRPVRKDGFLLPIKRLVRTASGFQRSLTALSTAVGREAWSSSGWLTIGCASGGRKCPRPWSSACASRLRRPRRCAEMLTERPREDVGRSRTSCAPRPKRRRSAVGWRTRLPRGVKPKMRDREQRPRRTDRGERQKTSGGAPLRRRRGGEALRKRGSVQRRKKDEGQKLKQNVRGKRQRRSVSGLQRRRRGESVPKMRGGGQNPRLSG
mmetsp:Transcript_141552/g.249788  ORF Transcript_141552/g.249788 Transcript_141552/m.249788 type:complete len:214 (+) Transcript_141552:134-775(+)